MKISHRLAALALGLTMTVSLAACGGPQSPAGPSGSTGSTELSGTVSTNGSTSMDKVVGALNEQFMLDNQGVKVTYDPTGSGTGIEAVKNGTCDIGLSSRNLKDEEKSAGLTGTVLALDGIAVVVNTENTVSDLTLEQVADLYTGAITNWSALGGPDAPVAVVGREAGSGTRDGFESITGVGEDAVYGQELTSTGAVLEAVKANPNAIGYASLSSVQDTVKALSIGGVACTEATVSDGTYPIQRPFVLVTVEGKELSAAAQAWFNFVTSTAANDVITAAGAIPVAK